MDLISRMLRKETPAVRFAAVHRYDEPMTIMLVPLTEAERPALIADFQESFEHFQGNPQGSFVGERLAAREQSPAGPSEGSATAQPILPLSDIEESLRMRRERSPIASLRTAMSWATSSSPLPVIEARFSFSQ